MARGSVSSSEGMYIVASRTFNPLSTEPSFSTWGGGNDVTWEVTVNGEGAGIYFDDKDAADAFVASARPAQSPQARPSLARISLDPIREEIVSQAKAYGVPASLAAAVIQKESNFDPNAVNKASGDYGLMQVNKSSFGKKLADEHGFAFTVDGARVKSDWRYNIHVGMSILKNAYQSALLHGGDVPRITYAQYNSYKHWTDYAIPGRRIFKNVEAFMQIYDQYPH